MFDLQIVIPIYNSASSIPILIQELNQLGEQLKLEFEVIFIDDKSQDASLALLEEAKPSFPSRIYALSKNIGQHSATTFGLAQCSAPYVVTMDDDLQHNPQHILLLYEAISKHDLDLVYACFIEKQHQKWRNLGTALLKKIFESQSKNFEYVTAYRIMHQRLYKLFQNSLKPIVFLDAILLQNTEQVGHIEIQHQKRPFGESTYSKVTLLRFALRMLFLHSSLPLKLVTRFGFALTLLSFFGVVYFVIQKYTTGAPLGFTSLIVAILFSTGIILCTIGIIGEFLRRMWQEQQGYQEVIARKK
jgi:glycosyltransferase involved in cell wall biosynthesis